ncbi:hypothetical protein FIBSPDRAFT_964081 [Athelia psychrophila]|uniref:Uncharacterized protein n=1 Tax=Athelia psychrophila TaxID=1759441 RepID=A0A165Y931_9AGAM|nr:hypothetical protein FIBSPDRAFT_964081 [Fibularhizoctonia sp. CBS 109695]
MGDKQGHPFKLAVLAKDIRRVALANVDAGSAGPIPSQSLGSTYNTLFTLLLMSSSNTVASPIALIKRVLQAICLPRHNRPRGLSSLQPRWDQRQQHCTTDVRNNELKDGLNALRGICLRSFPEVIADVQMGYVVYGMRTGGAGGGWIRAHVGDESIIVEHFMSDVANTVLISLTALSKQKRPAFCSIFLLNHVAYLHMHLALETRNANLPALLARPTLDLLQSNFRTAKADYFNANFMPLRRPLDKATTKEKFTRFFALQSARGGDGALPDGADAGG